MVYYLGRRDTSYFVIFGVYGGGGGFFFIHFLSFFIGGIGIFT